MTFPAATSTSLMMTQEAVKERKCLVDVKMDLITGGKTCEREVPSGLMTPLAGEEAKLMTVVLPLRGFANFLKT